MVKYQTARDVAWILLNDNRDLFKEDSEEPIDLNEFRKRVESEALLCTQNGFTVEEVYEELLSIINKFFSARLTKETSVMVYDPRLGKNSLETLLKKLREGQMSPVEPQSNDRIDLLQVIDNLLAVLLVERSKIQDNLHFTAESRTALARNEEGVKALLRSFDNVIFEENESYDDHCQ